MKEIILATGNPGKIKELQTFLAPIRCTPQAVLGISDAEETGLSFIENAILKARHASQIAQQPALADDSGLVVPALNGQPGIYSARFSGPSANDQRNIQLLLDKMSNLPQGSRSAFFYCAIAFIQHPLDPTPLIATGKFIGEIASIPRGVQGFGYDPIFYIPKYHCTAAELAPEIKNQISHRAQALKQLLLQLSI